jgi:superfamily II DNA or RNA helicase
VAEERLGAIFVRGSDLDRLTPEDFQIIEAWLAEQPVIPQRKKPDPHQLVALDEIFGGLLRGPRATALMACGSGKTLVALWTAERIDARTVLILLPSLALIRQTLHVWLHETSWLDVQFLCVCSDPTVQGEEDSLLVRPSDLDFAVTTKSDDVRRFLERPSDSVRLVFSTYQSSKVVAEAVTGLPPFDFAVFDEAHKTAGRERARFALALKDENLPIARRLFMTATPRHYDVAKKDKFGESKVVFSMDAPETYGPVVHRLPFSAAAKAGIITNYKVIISVVTSEMVTNEALRLGVVLIDGDEVKARQVANQIALKSAIEKYKVSKVFTFHSKVASAKSFTSAGPEGIGTHLDDFHCAHIEGAMTTAFRERLMRDFAAAPQAILSNARCLTEGVDVPAVDMVAFLSPKRSLVDIVQATGRAMRLSPETGKEFGYVLVPLYVEKARGETIEQAVLRSNFDEVWKVLQGLKEQDDLLGQTIAEMRMERGRTGGFDDSRFRKRVEFLCPELSLEMLRSTITAACIDAIGENWFERYGQLVVHHQQHGNCDMPARWPANQKLASWVVDQRVRKKDGNLAAEKVELLNQLGFNWDPRGKNWRTIYRELVKYKKRFGDCRVPQNWSENKSLAHWVATQRLDYSKCEIHFDRIDLLERIGFEWRVGNSTWDERFAELCAFKKRFGHTRVRVKWAENPLLGSWVVGQRVKYRKQELADELVQKLNDIGFEWDGRIVAKKPEKPILDPDKKWRENFSRFKDYSISSGSAKVKVVDEYTKKLNRWVLNQRLSKKRGDLSDSRANALEQIGFIWETRSTDSYVAVLGSNLSWRDMFSELVHFYKLQGHCNVPDDWIAQPDLEGWVSMQRQRYQRKQLSPDKIRQLNEIGFSWNTHDGGWDLMFAKFAEHMRQMNDEKLSDVVPSPDLRRWMGVQRLHKKSGKLKKSREERLNSVGFDWLPHEDRWRTMFFRLLKYREAVGDCRVPDRWIGDKQLARWVKTQRSMRLKGKLLAERIGELEAVGFDWNPSLDVGLRIDRGWSSMFTRLQEYRKQFGNTLVPQGWKSDTSLADWVTSQRIAHNSGRLSSERREKLIELGFDWDPIATRWEEMFQQLIRFRDERGHTNVPQGNPELKELSTWVRNQRKAKSQNQPIMVERAKRLDEIGFVWRMVKRDAWEKDFEDLVAFKREHGHCNVPQKDAHFKRLGKWVNTQRTFHKRGKLKPDRFQRLQSLGFVWNTKMK